MFAADGDKSEPALHHVHFSGAWFLGEALSL